MDSLSLIQYRITDHCFKHNKHIINRVVKTNKSSGNDRDHSFAVMPRNWSSACPNLRANIKAEILK